MEPPVLKLIDDLKKVFAINKVSIFCVQLKRSKNSKDSFKIIYLRADIIRVFIFCNEQCVNILTILS